jgi:hypothetical protein
MTCNNVEHEYKWQSLFKNLHRQEGLLVQECHNNVHKYKKEFFYWHCFGNTHIEAKD